ncbi:MAG: GC-type dockerin domain-anchored protein [Phycisphaerales bacterium JB059]
MHNRIMQAVALGALTVAPAFAGGGETIITFDTGAEGFSLNGWDTTSPTGVNPGALLHWEDFIYIFGLSLRNDTNSAFLGDLSRYGQVEMGVDVLVNYIAFFGSPVTREWVLELRDYDNVPDGYPYVSVWYVIGTLPTNSEDGWVRFSVQFDPSQTELPAGWGGYGAEDPDTFEPILPENRTFADVVASVDEMLFTTYVPGFFYGFTNFNLQVDNITIRSINAGCNEADVAEPFGVLDFSDVTSFLSAFSLGDSVADLAEPFGTYDFSDVVAFLAAFGAGCP